MTSINLMITIPFGNEKTQDVINALNAFITEGQGLVVMNAKDRFEPYVNLEDVVGLIVSFHEHDLHIKNSIKGVNFYVTYCEMKILDTPNSVCLRQMIADKLCVRVTCLVNDGKILSAKIILGE